MEALKSAYKRVGDAAFAMLASWNSERSMVDSK
jgi:hypothetical protein